MRSAEKFDKKFSPVTKRKSNLIFLGNGGRNGSSRGLSGGQCSIDAKIKIDPVVDVSGNYEVMLEMVIAPQVGR